MTSTFTDADWAAMMPAVRPARSLFDDPDAGKDKNGLQVRDQHHRLLGWLSEPHPKTIRRGQQVVLPGKARFEVDFMPSDPFSSSPYPARDLNLVLETRDISASVMRNEILPHAVMQKAAVPTYATETSHFASYADIFTWIVVVPTPAQMLDLYLRDEFVPFEKA